MIQMSSLPSPTPLLPNTVVFTANIGSSLWTKPTLYPGLTYVAFSDKEPPEGWSWVRVEADNTPELNNRISKRIKIDPWSYLDCRWDTAIWVDSNISLRQDPRFINAHFACHYHRKRHCVYDEVAECLRLRKATPSELLRQKADYLQRGHPEHWGLWENGFSIRTNTPKIEALCKSWKAELEEYTQRDQISLPIVLREHNMSPVLVGANIWNSVWVAIKAKPLRLGRC